MQNPASRPGRLSTSNFFLSVVTEKKKIKMHPCCREPVLMLSKGTGAGTEKIFSAE